MAPERPRGPLDRREFLCAGGLLLGGLANTPGMAQAPLPSGVRVVWDLGKAHREKTATRERVCLNGLWRWQPAKEVANAVPAEGWGYFKVPGCWPGITDYMQKDCQTLYPHPNWKDVDLRRTYGGLVPARDRPSPSGWAGRRIALCAEYVNSFAVVYVDGKKAGEIRFPGGELDLTAGVPPRRQARAQPARGGPAAEGRHALLHRHRLGPGGEGHGAAARPVRRRLPRSARPPVRGIADVKVDTSVRKGQITFDAALAGSRRRRPLFPARPDRAGRPRPSREFTSKAFKAGDLKDGRIAFTEKWKPEKLWDIHTPQNMFTAEVSLLDAAGKLAGRLPSPCASGSASSGSTAATST